MNTDTDNDDISMLKLPQGHSITPCTDPSVDPNFDPNVKRLEDPLDPYLTSISPYVKSWLQADSPLTMADLALTRTWISGTTIGQRIREIIIYNSTAYDMRIGQADNNPSAGWKTLSVVNQTHKLVPTSKPSGTIGPGEANSYILSGSDVDGRIILDAYDHETGIFNCNILISFTKNTWQTADYYIETNREHRNFDVTALDTWGNEWYIPAWGMGGKQDNHINSGTGFGQNNHAVIAFCLGDDVLKIGEIPQSGKCDLYEQGFYSSLGSRPPTSAINRPDQVWSPVVDRWRAGKGGEVMGNLIGGLIFGCGWLFGGKDQPKPTPTWDFSSDDPHDGKTYVISDRKSGKALGCTNSTEEEMAKLSLSVPNFISDTSQLWEITQSTRGAYSGFYVIRNKSKKGDGRAEDVLTWAWSSFIAFSTYNPESRTCHWRIGYSQDKRAYVIAACGPSSKDPNITAVLTAPLMYNLYTMDTRSAFVITPCQEFIFTEFTPLVAGNEYTFTSRLSGKVMDVQGGEKDEGTNVVQYDYHGSRNQRWALSLKVDNPRIHILRTSYPPHYVLHSKSSAKTAPVTIESTLHTSVSNYTWDIEPTLNGAYKIVGSFKKPLDVKDGDLENSVPLQTYEANDTLAQQWRIDLVQSKRREHDKSDLDSRIEKAEHDIAEVEKQIHESGDPKGALKKWIENNRQELERMKLERDQQKSHQTDTGLS